ncbi:MAG: adenosine deaminase [Betaproteobacteria bacterium HGW-Betaproteobacteria-10]|nr:MAG: adenosine deaminase [Betaproteobacteria bacterium HGW-Betaproteobacteria-10]
MNILLCTLGASWPVIPEIFGFVAPDLLNLYAQHPDQAKLSELRARHGLATPDELWICTTEGVQTQKSLAQTQAWWAALGAPIALRIWTAAGTDQLATQAECDHIRELTLRVALLAAERCNGGQLTLSLAGGRKTMSADLQWAGTLFGTEAMLHVVTPELLFGSEIHTQLIKQPTPALFAQALPEQLAAVITPLVVGTARRDELLDIELDGRTVSSRHFFLPLAENELSWPLTAAGATLTSDIQARQRQGSRLLGNFIAQLAESEKHENWRSLYRLPPAQIETLRQTRLSAVDRPWLVKIPKADLHRHLGGCLNLADQRQVGAAVWHAMNNNERQQAQNNVAHLLNTPSWGWHWPDDLTKTGQRAANVAALLVHASAAQLEDNLYAITEPRLALRHRQAHGFANYERPGELTGSAILGHPAALDPYAQAIVKQAKSEGLAYLELRGSPHKYRPHDPAAFVGELATALIKAGANQANDSESPCIRFIWILDRRQQNSLTSTVDRAIQAFADSNGFLVGLDLAGDEATSQPEALAPCFIAAFRECLPITIHAGEGEAADNIWQAAYHLHADRIGHGLSLAERPELASRFRNRGIALELCPTSNREVIGYRDPAIAESAAYPNYPLRTFIDLGLPLTLCTDNPGISRTTLADEYLTAARMTQGGLSQWETLALIKQGFAHSFLPAAERESLLKQIDQRIYQQLAGTSQP